jgi:hypothetical protein
VTITQRHDLSSAQTLRSARLLTLGGFPEYLGATLQEASWKAAWMPCEWSRFSGAISCASITMILRQKITAGLTPAVVFATL